MLLRPDNDAGGIFERVPAKPFRWHRLSQRDGPSFRGQELTLSGFHREGRQEELGETIRSFGCLYFCLEGWSGRVALDHLLCEIECDGPIRVRGKHQAREKALSQIRIGIAVTPSVRGAGGCNQRSDLLRTEAQFLQ